MADEIQAKGFAKVRIAPTRSEGVMALTLTDSRKKAARFLINPKALNALLLPLLGLATRWADRPDLGVETLKLAAAALVQRIGANSGSSSH